MLAGKATPIPAFTRAVIPNVNSTTAISALDPLSCGGFNGDGMFSEFQPNRNPNYPLMQPRRDSQPRILLRTKRLGCLVLMEGGG